jgi:DNA-binding transcriptional LysR family regulator
MPTGIIRITATDHTTRTILWPRLSEVLCHYPEIKVEIITDYGLSDIVADGYDIGVREGNQVAKDMIAVRIGPDARMAIVASPDYFKERTPPKTPQDLTRHNCINLRLPTHGGFYAWELKKGKREVQARVDGQVAFNGTYELLAAALSGYGLAYLPEDIASEHVKAGQLQRVMEDWCPTFPGLHAYYASRRQSSRAMSIVIDALRYRH